MASWKVDHRRGDYFLHNGKEPTRFRYSPKSNPDVPWLMRRMRELEVPISFTMGLKEIYFTRLHGTHGDYRGGILRLSTDKRSWEIADVVLVHELAHHLDEVLGITKNKRLIEEKVTRSQHMPDGYAQKNTGEYLACGFEVYYCGEPKARVKMKKKNPFLYRTIETIHQKFSRL